ncbi:MAG: carbonic anhydrase [Candidatus Eisenbacteria bacterium]|nr:carbonic anhydrase [Candidatus Eisenbacteria bacterium]
MEESNVEQTERVDPEGALALLMEGNMRFVQGALQHPHASVGWRRALLAGQRPFAAVASCSDSRVSPEILFDRGLGDLFVVRTAGHVLGEAGIASLEYAVLHLHVPLIIVLGHAECGAVHAALARADALPGHLSHLARAIAPAIGWVLEEARRTGEEKAERAAEQAMQEALDSAESAPRFVAHNRVAQLHARLTAEALPVESSVIRERVAQGSLRVQAAYYELDCGKVDLLD